MTISELIEDVGTLQQMLLDDPLKDKVELLRPDNRRRESYANLRNEIVKYRESAPVPEFLFECTSPDRAMAYIGSHNRNPAFRSRLINELFDGFWRWAETAHGTARPAAFAVDKDGIASSLWTGRASPAEQAAVVLQLAPLALEGLQALIDAETHRLSNKPPEPIDADLLPSLRALYAAVGELVSVLESNSGDASYLRAEVARLSRRVFGAGQHIGRLTLAATGPATASVLPTWGTMKVLELISGATFDGAAVATLAAGFLAVGAAAEAGLVRKQMTISIGHPLRPSAADED